MDCGDDSTNISVLLRALSQLELSVEDSVYRQELTTLIKNVQQVHCLFLFGFFFFFPYFMFEMKARF